MNGRKTALIRKEFRLTKAQLKKFRKLKKKFGVLSDAEAMRQLINKGCR